MPIDLLLKLCDFLNLHLLVLNPDISFQFKFNDLKSKKAFEYLDKGTGVIDLDKFVRWWGCTPDQLKEFS